MCSCCPEPLDLRIDSKKIESDLDAIPKYYSEDYDSSYEPGPCGYVPNVAHSVDYSSDIYHREAVSHSQTWRRQPSPASDEGFVEELSLPENLPNFDKIQNLPSEGEQQNMPESRPASSSCTKERKRQRESPPIADKERRKPGRKPGQVSNVLHLWEFMRDLLHGPEYSGIIEWISKKDGVFRVVNSSEVARLWGEKKNNKKKMTYEKLSRSLRYSRLEGYFSNLPKDKNYPKKLCFKFGPKSRDWH